MLHKWRDLFSDNREEEAQRLIFEMYYHQIYKTAYFIVRDQGLAQDVVQETFIKAFKHLHKVKDGSSLGPWLGTIASRTAIDFLRKKKKWNEIPIEDVIINSRYADAHETVENQVEKRWLINWIRRVIQSLSPEYRQVIILKAEYGLKDEEIAEMLEIKLGTVKSRIYRAREKMRSFMEQEIEKESDIL